MRHLQVSHLSPLISCPVSTATISHPHHLLSTAAPLIPPLTTAPGGDLSHLNSNANKFTLKRVTIKSEAKKGKTEADERVQKEIEKRAVREAVAKVVAVAAVAAQKETKPKQAPEATDEAKDEVSGKASVKEVFPITRSSSHSHRLSPSRQLYVDLGISGFNNPSIDPFAMSQLSAILGQKIMCNDRSAAFARSTLMSGGPADTVFGRPSPMAHSSSQGKRDKDRRSVAPTGLGSSSGSSSSFAGAEILEPVAPLEVSANRWTPTSLTKKGQPVDSESPELVDKKIRSLLNKLTMERFDSISDQIISWANRSEKEKDGRTLVQVIRLVIEKATDEATWSEMYARLCRKMMDQISPNVHGDGAKHADGEFFASGQLFRNCLLSRGQDDFERGWVQKEATAAAAATKASQDKAAKAAEGENKDEESALYSEEYYAAQKAKRQGLGLIKFICELFKLQMLTERIMHECVKKMLGNVENPEEEIESLCKLLTTVGQILDTPKARAPMDVYFSLMKELTKSPNANSRMRFMLQDVIELRKHKLVTRAVESTHEDAQLVADLFERAVSRNLCSPASFEKGFTPTAEVIDDIVIDAPKAMDLFAIMIKGSHLHLDEARRTRLISKSKDAPKLAQALIGCTPSRRMTQATDLSAYSYPGLAIKSELATITTGPSHTTSVDFDTGVSSPLGIASSDWVHTGIQHPTELHSTSKLPQQAAVGIIEDVVWEFDTQSTFSPVDSLSTCPVQPRMSRRTADEHIERSATLLLGLHDVGALAVFRDLPASYHGRLVDRLVSGAMEPGTDPLHAQVLAYFFCWGAERRLCSTAAFEEGISMTTSALKDIAAEVPDAFERYAVIVKGMGLHTDSGWRARILESLGDYGPKLVELFSVSL